MLKLFLFFLESGSTLFALACLSKYLGYSKCPKISNILFHTIIGIKHGFSCINIRQVPREVLKTEAGGRGFQHLPEDLANVNALKNHVRSLVLHKNWKHLLHFALFLALFLFCLFIDVSRTQFPRTMLVLGPGSTHLVTAANLWPRYDHIESCEAMH